MTIKEILQKTKNKEKLTEIEIKILTDYVMKKFAIANKNLKENRKFNSWHQSTFFIDKNFFPAVKNGAVNVSAFNFNNVIDFFIGIGYNIYIER